MSGGFGIHLVVAKYSGSTGAYVWEHDYLASAGGSANDVAIDSNGNVVATGSYFGTINVGGGALSSGTTTHMLTFVLTSTGAYHTQRTATGSFSTGVAVASASNIVETTGVFRGTAHFGGDPLVSTTAPSCATPSNIFVTATT